MSEVVKVERHDAIAIIKISNPPVNALSAAVRQGIAAAIKEVSADSSVQGVVLACEGRTFVAGADITEFGKPPSLPD